MSTRHQPELAGLAEQAPGHREILGFDFGGRRQHFVGGEFDGGLGDLPVFFGEILGREYVLRLAFLGEKAAALDPFCRLRCALLVAMSVHL